MTVAPPTDLAGAVDLLVAALPDDVVVTDADRVGKYRHDRFEDLPAGQPCAVVRAQDTEQVRTALRWATEHRVPVVPRGAGTSLSGGATAVDGCLVLTLERMTGVRIDPDRRVAHVQPGAHMSRKGTGTAIAHPARRSSRRPMTSASRPAA